MTPVFLLGFFPCTHVACESKSSSLPASPTAHTHIVPAGVCKAEAQQMSPPPQPPCPMRRVALAHLSLLVFLVLLFIRSLMFWDTFSCNTTTNLSPLAAAPTVSSIKTCCTSCSLALVLTVRELLLKYLAPTLLHKDVPSFLFPPGNTLAWHEQLDL